MATESIAKKPAGEEGSRIIRVERKHDSRIPGYVFRVNEYRAGEFVRFHGQRHSYRDALVDALELQEAS